MLVTAQQCPRCNKPVYLSFAELHEFGDVEIMEKMYAKSVKNAKDTIPNPGKNIGPATPPTGHDIFDDLINVAGLVFCPDCGMPSLFCFKIERILYINHQVQLQEYTTVKTQHELKDTIFEVYPAPNPLHDDEAWPAEIRGQFRDAQSFVFQKVTPSIIITTCRTVLDVSVKKLGAKGKNIFERVENLTTAGIITKPIADWSHDIRKFGNDATHDAEGTHEDAVAFVEFLKVFLNVAFALPKKIEDRRNK